MDLPTIWFVAIAVLWTGYFVLEGFDFGVGTLLGVLGRNDIDRRVMINSIGPVWDGNEVWLITAIGATFAAFPAWYGSMLSGFYLPMLVILLALIARGVAFEYRGKVDDARWRRRWDIAIVAGSSVPAFLWGVLLADFVRGVPMDAEHVVRAGLADVFNPYALLGGVLTLGLFALHGAVFLALKTDGPVRRAARRTAGRLALVVVPAAVAFLGWTQAEHGTWWTLPVALVAVLALVAGSGLAARGREGWAFTATAVTVVGLTVVVFGSMFPIVLSSTTDPAFSLTVAAAASAPYTLTLMSWLALVLLPLVIGYQAWSYWVFRKRVAPPPASPPSANRGISATESG
ncbi:cytochrome d ubiquinol oxidase subunit II [Pseudonocardia asaccharolytica]|uniref:Cytochrome c oxidase assembly protein n=1 Tax=Pseudonocardia asaccharolytica DSM 44247 = NBRC 16224 TaxID=1123024 RepID=A0A511D5E6_9PSEU|nr:cytochrome d ubiquinol oxidase subunit II [Pseudonocardia asaccharolytica]GEL20019.1 cytochrome c oxidase assembly protein [Pseudonocardia asaccharolytica DSM 44247 = NBRC 16224]